MLNYSTSFLYKYQPFNVLSLDNLSNKYIWFSSPDKLNDPLDGRNIYRINEPDDIKWQEIFINFELEKYPRFSNLFGYIKKGISDKEKEMQDTIRILAYENLFLSISEKKRVACFSKTNNVYLMWSHYAEGHRGFCLEFNISYPPFKQAKDVTYLESYIWIDMEEILSGNLNLEKFLDKKTEIWKYEEEMRIIGEKEKVEYDKHALNGIYFGLNMPEGHKKIIAAIIQNNEYPTWMFDTSYLVNNLGFSYRPVIFDCEFNRFTSDGTAPKVIKFI